MSHKCFIDIFEIHSPFIVTHNKCIINVTQNVMYMGLINKVDMVCLSPVGYGV